MSILDEISHVVWQSKYCCQDIEHCDASIEQTWQRLAKSIAINESDKKKWIKEFYTLLEDFQFLPGGRIIAGAGLNKDVTLMNCFVMGRLEDSIDGIFEGLKEGAKTMQFGGGVGYDFSTLRPFGEIAETSGTIASGPVSFMKVWNAMCETMLSTGNRRGAMMACLKDDHPDIERFIEAKRESSELTNFNISVLISQKFLEAVEKDEQWPLVFQQRTYKKVSAQKLWQKIVETSIESSEPGVLFVNRIQQMNNLWYCEDISATNPCGEVPLPPYGACNLGSFNLVKFVDKAFEVDASFNFGKLRKFVPTALRFMDNVLDITRYPLGRQKEKSQKTRRVGIGVTGLGSALAMLNLTYGETESLEFIDQLMRELSETLYFSSIELGREKGAFPDFIPEKFLSGGFIKNQSKDLQQSIREHGLRNSHLMAIAPTGTISLLAHNVSSGIEPIFKLSYQRKMRLNNREIRELNVEDFAFSEWKKMHGNKTPSSHFVTAEQVSPEKQLRVMAIMQKYVDQAISKTIILPEEADIEKYSDLFLQANHLGLKGCTVYRPSILRGSVLS